MKFIARTTAPLRAATVETYQSGRLFGDLGHRVGARLDLCLDASVDRRLEARLVACDGTVARRDPGAQTILRSNKKAARWAAFP